MRNVKSYLRCRHTQAHEIRPHKHGCMFWTMITHFNAYDTTPYVTDTTTPVWFSLGHIGHAPLFGNFSQSARQINSNHGQF
jgi:hypothetical protein